jgi:hypothetical protein
MLTPEIHFDGLDDFRTWIKKRIDRPTDTSAVDRIWSLVEDYEAGWLISKKEIVLAADLRNYYTHYDLSKEKVLPPLQDRPVEMDKLGERLRNLCEVILLVQIGLDTKTAQQRIEKANRRFS